MNHEADENDARSPGLSSSCSSAMTSHTGTPLLAEVPSTSAVPPLSLDAFNEKLLIHPGGEEQTVLSCASQSHVATRSRRRYEVDVFFDRQVQNAQANQPSPQGLKGKGKGKQTAEASIPLEQPKLATPVSLFPATNMSQFDTRSEDYIPLDGFVVEVEET